MIKKEILERGKRLSEEVDRMFELMEFAPPTEIQETSLSKIWSYTEDYDVAIITAFRKENINCIKYREDYEEKKGDKFNTKENLERNGDLRAVIIDKGYGYTEVSGRYIENFNTPEAIEVGEKVFFVVNWNKDKDFFPTIIKLGKYFCQDAVFLKPIGEDAYLYGTNNASDPGLDNKIPIGKFKSGESQFMTRVGKSKKPFHFGENYNNIGRYAISLRAKKVLSNL